MNQFLCTLLAFCSLFSSEKVINILTNKNLSGTYIDIRGSYSIENEAGYTLSSSYYGHAAYLFPTDEGIRWAKMYPYKTITIVPTSPSTQILVDGIEHTGSLTIYLINKKINLVSTTSVDLFIHSYLENIVQSLPKETQIAALLALKSDLFSQIHSQSKHFWNIESSDYGVQGSSPMWPTSPYKKIINQVSKLMLTYKNKPFKANITKHCAGSTARYCDIFHNKTPSPRGVQSPEARAGRLHTQWTYSMNRMDFTKAFSLPDISAIKNFKEPSSDKSYALRCSTETSSVGIPFSRLQKVLGKHNLKSNDFQVRLTDKSITFTGYGRGSGTGLCLYSSAILAKQGQSYQSILQFFFPDTYIRKMVQKNGTP